jgi:hypothetical protein
MKVLQAGLNQQAPVLIYDKTKPYLAGRTFSKSITGLTVYGPPLTSFENSFLDTGLAPTATKTTSNGRQFQLLTITTGIATIALYNVDTTGQTAPTYVGKILVRLPNAAATTHTFRGFEVYDGPNAGTVTGWQIYLGTVGTVLINGGLFLVNNIAYADFSPTSPPTIEMAVASSAKAVYLMADPGAIGVNNTLTAMQGLSHDTTARRLYFHNNVLATTQFAVFDPTPAPTITIQTASSANVNTTATTFNFTGHGYNANDPVILIGTVPTGFTASTSAAAQTVYFVRNQTSNTFELSATTGGVSILGTSVVSGTQAARAFGTSTAQWLSIRTGTLTGFVGTFLLTNSEQVVVPTQTTDPTIPAAVNNQTCIFVATTANFYLFKVSEITNGATTLPTMVTVNNLGTGIDYTAISTAYALYSPVVGRVVYVSNATIFYVKRWINSAIDSSFGALTTTYLENSANSPYAFSGATVINIESANGWLYSISSTIGQRGVISMDLHSDSMFGYSYVTSPVQDTSAILKPRTIQTVERLFDLTASMVFSYKTAATYSDATFNSPTTGWTVLPTATDPSVIGLNNFTQFRIDFGIANGNVNTPAQINELYMSYDGKIEMSDYWAGDNDNTTQGSGSPSYVSFIQKVLYPSFPSTLFLRGYDASGNQTVGTLDTVTNVGVVSYSTDGGTSWSAGVGPNTVGTRLRFLIASTPASIAYCSIRES